METPRHTGLIESLFGGEPYSNAKYRLPLCAAALIFILALLPFIPGKGIDDLIGPAAGAFITLQALGDRVWMRSVRAAAWLRLAGNVAMFAGVGAIALHHYIEHQWLAFAFFFMLCAAFVAGVAYSIVKFLRVRGTGAQDQS